MPVKRKKYKDPPRYRNVSDWYEGKVKVAYSGVLKDMLKALKNAKPIPAK